MDDRLSSLAQLLSEQHIRRLERAAPLDCLDYTFDMPLEGDGWHNRETDGYKYWRFTGPGSTATLFFPFIRAPDRTVRLSIFHAVSPAHLERLSVTYNGVGLVCTERRSAQVTFRVPDPALQKMSHVVLEFATPAPVRPHQNDDRLLGIALTRIEVF